MNKIIRRFASILLISLILGCQVGVAFASQYRTSDKTASRQSLVARLDKVGVTTIQEFRTAAPPNVQHCLDLCLAIVKRLINNTIADIEAVNNIMAILLEPLGIEPILLPFKPIR